MARYESPRVTRVELRIEEAVLTACKVNSGMLRAAQWFNLEGCGFFISCQNAGS